MLLQLISARDEPGASSSPNTTYKHWLHTFNNDATPATAILDRLIHHCEEIATTGKRHRMKDKADPPRNT